MSLSRFLLDGARPRMRTLALAAAAGTASLALVVDAGAAPDPVAEANGVCRSLRNALVVDVAPPAMGRRPPSARELVRTGRAFVPLGDRAHDRLVAIAAEADDPELTALVDAYGAALDRLEELVADGALATLYEDAPLRQAFATTNALAVRAGAPDCVL